MASRDVTAQRTVGPQAALQETYVKGDVQSLLDAGAELGQQIIKSGQEAKITENYSMAQMDLNRLKSQIEVDYEHDPFQGAKKLKEEQSKIFEAYGKEISPFFRAPWDENVRELGFKVDAETEAWAFKQTRVNTVNSINRAIKNNLSQATVDGENFGNSDATEIGSLLNYQDSRNKLASFGDGNLGSETTTQMLEGYNEDYLKSFLSGVSDTNPLKALRMLDDPNVKASFRIISNSPK